MKRVMCVWLPNFPIQRLLCERPELRGRACVLYESTHQGAQVVYGSAQAVSAGVIPGMSLAEAQALLEASSVANQAESCFVAADPDGDRQALQALVELCQNFSPRVALDPVPRHDSLLVDLTGCSHLFGSEWKLACRVALTLHGCGFFAVLGIAETIGAAWAVAHYHALRPGPSENLLELPVEALRLPPQIVHTLHRLDLYRIGQVMRLPRTSLPARFTRLLTERLDQAFGRVAEDFEPAPFPERLAASRDFEHPISGSRTLRNFLQSLIDQLLDKLRPRCQGVCRFTVQLHSAEGSTVMIPVGLARPSTSLPHLMKLLTLQLERHHIPERLERLDVQVDRADRLETRQHQLFDDPSTRDQEGLAIDLIDRFSSRLGEHSVLHCQCVPEAQPELAVEYEPWIAALSGKRAEQGSQQEISLNRSIHDPVRPLRLCSQPVPVEAASVVPDGPPIRLFWKGHTWPIVRHWGPERLESGWWREQGIQRDYYRVELDDGRLLWLFRDRQAGQWYMHGFFD